jgi:hypothetical protein
MRGDIALEILGRGIYLPLLASTAAAIGVRARTRHFTRCLSDRAIIPAATRRPIGAEVRAPL